MLCENAPFIYSLYFMKFNGLVHNGIPCYDDFPFVFLFSCGIILKLQIVIWFLDR